MVSLSNNGIPQMMVFDAGTGDYTDGTANDTKQKTAWDIDVMYSGAANVDHVYTYAAKPEENNTALFPVTNGIVDYTKVMFSKEGTDSGITYKYEDGFFCSKMYGINGNGYDGYKPSDLNNEGADWIDFLTTSHDTKQDTFMIMTVPMSALGVTADQVASEGIGVMSISTFGESGIGSLPQDLTMLDNVSEDYVSKQGASDPSTSLEKSDSDVVTVALARLGGKADAPTKTKNPTKTSEPTEEPEVTETPTVDETPAADKTPDVEETKVPEETKEPDVEETKTPDTTETPAVDETKTPDATETPIATPIVVEVTSTEQMVVNFGADKSAPQASGTTLTLEAKPMNTTGTCQYQFTIDGQLVQDYSENATYQWNALTGKHTIQVSVKDENGNTVSVSKSYTVEGEVVETEKTSGYGRANDCTNGSTYGCTGSYPECTRCSKPVSNDSRA